MGLVVVISEIREEVIQLVRRQHAFIDNDLGRKTTNVKQRTFDEFFVRT